MRRLFGMNILAVVLFFGLTSALPARSFFDQISDPTLISLDKGNGESVTSSTTLQDDDGLVLTLPAAASGATTWHLTYHLFIDGATAGDFKANLALANGGTYKFGAICLSPNATSSEGVVYVSSTSSNGADVYCGTAGANVGIPITLEATVVTAANTGETVTLQWAQWISSATPTRIFSHANVIATRIQ